MLKVDKDYQDKLVKYFANKVYNTSDILDDSKYTHINSIVKSFLISLPFEQNGKIHTNTILSSHDNNNLIIEIFFDKLETAFGKNSRNVFINTSKKPIIDVASTDKEKQVKVIKQFILEKYSRMYSNFRNIHGQKLIEENDSHICPYCYRSYIGVVETEDGSKSITPDLDHFYPKSRYPFLAVTLSNLVPSCLFCNQRAKNDADFYKTSIYPPNEIFNEIEFDFDVYLNKIFIKNYDKLVDNIKYKTHLDTFLIQETYATHTEILKNIINKNQKYRKSKIEDIAKHTVGLSSFDIKKMVFYEYEFMNKKKELLYKLKKDLYNSIVL